MNVKEEQKLLREMRVASRAYRNRPGVADVELGFKFIQGSPTQQLSIRFRVERKRPTSTLSKKELLPHKIAGLPTDVIEQGNRPEAAVKTSHHHTTPIRCGATIQSEIFRNSSWMGTLGTPLAINHRLFFCTCYHVLFSGVSEQFVYDQYANRLPVYLRSAGSLLPVGVAASYYGKKLDYATIIPQVPIDPLQPIRGIAGPVMGWIYPQIGMQLCKSGASTGVTYGIVDGRSLHDVSEISIYGNNQPDKPLSDRGDSGSAWVHVRDDKLWLVGLHYARGISPLWARAKSFASIYASLRQFTHPNKLTSIV